MAIDSEPVSEPAKPARTITPQVRTVKITVDLPDGGPYTAEIIREHTAHDETGAIVKDYEDYAQHVLRFTTDVLPSMLPEKPFLMRDLRDGLDLLDVRLPHFPPF